MLQYMGSQRVGHDLAIEQRQQIYRIGVSRKMTPQTHWLISLQYSGKVLGTLKVNQGEGRHSLIS